MGQQRKLQGFAVAIALGLGLFAVDHAVAAPGSAVCRALEAELSSGGGRNQRYSTAAEKQRREIEKLRRQQAAAGCGGFSLDRQCSRLAGLARSMNANLAKLNGQSGGGRPRAQVRAEYNANNCSANRQRTVERQAPEEGIFSRLFGTPVTRDQRGAPPLAYWNTVEPRRADRGESVRLQAPDAGLRAGTVRTFCVRTCDGYYFPMSPSSSRSDMDRDEQNCRAACPGAETSLYFHESGQEDAEAMVSRANGQLYAALKTAFVYRESGALRSEQCSCGAKPGLLESASGTRLRGSQDVATTPFPKNRPDPISDPESLANADGNLTADSIRSLLSRGETVDVSRRNVRVVGPVFLPDPEAAEGPQAQARTVTR